MSSAAPPALLFTPAALPLFGAGLARYHPLGPRELATPCFWYRADRFPSPLALEGSRAPPRDHDPALLALVEDVVTVMRTSRPLAERLGAPVRTYAHVGFHAGADEAQVRAWFEAHGPVLDADALLRERRAARAAREGEALAYALRKRGAATPRGPWARARDHLLGGGDPPALDPGDHRALRELPTLLHGTSPRDWDDVQRRALDLAVQVPALLARVERGLALDDPTGDAFLRWRELLAERGVGDEAVEALAVASWAHVAWTPPGSERSPRAWWVLARAGADLDGFLRRNEGVERRRLLEGLFHAATAVWHAPPFRAVAEAVLAAHGDELPAHALLR